MINHIPFFMILLLSPAKIQRFSPKPAFESYSIPAFMKEAGELASHLRRLPAAELSRLLQTNHSLTRLNQDRYMQWQLPFTFENARQAALLFDGEAFRGLQASDFSEDDFRFAQLHLRILSGLYGILKPLDLISPYRLEVSTKLKTRAGNDLYPFWKEKVSNFLVRELRAAPKPSFVLNLASSEYFRMTDISNKGFPVVNAEFYEYKNDCFRQVVMYTKKARGMLARYVIKNRITCYDDLAGFSSEGYWLDPQQSTPSKLIYVR